MPYNNQPIPVDKSPMPLGKYRLYVKFTGAGVPDATRDTVVTGATTIEALKAWARQQIAELNSLNATPINVPLNQAFDVSAAAADAAIATSDAWVQKIVDIEEAKRKIARLTAAGVVANGALATQITALNTLISNTPATINTDFNAASAAAKTLMGAKL